MSKPRSAPCHFAAGQKRVKLVDGGIRVYTNAMGWPICGATGATFTTLQLGETTCKRCLSFLANTVRVEEAKP